MAITLILRQALIIDDMVVEGNERVSDTISLTNGQQFAVEGKVIADANGEDVLWTTGGGGLDTFSYGFIKSTRDIFVELRTDNGTPEFVLMEAKANVLTYLSPKVGGNTTESIDGSSLADGTDYDDVDQIRVQRDAADGSGDAVVALYLFN